MRSVKNRIAIVGCSGVDPVDAFSLAKNNWLDELLLIGEESTKLKDSVGGFIEKWAGHEHAAFRTGGLSDAANADLVVLNLVSRPRIGECRSEMLNRITKKVRREVTALVRGGFEGVFIVITEPVDLMALVTLEASGFEPHRVIGLGTGNGKRTSFFDDSSAMWCSGKQGTTNFVDQCDPNCAHFESVVALSARKGTADFRFTGNRISGMALCVTRICEAVIKDEHELLPVSAFLHGEYGLSGIFMTVPCIVGRNGVERVVKLPITSAEGRRMQSYAEELRSSLIQIDRRGSVAAGSVL